MVYLQLTKTKSRENHKKSLCFLLVVVPRYTFLSFVHVIINVQLAQRFFKISKRAKKKIPFICSIHIHNRKRTKNYSLWHLIRMGKELITNDSLS